MSSTKHAAIIGSGVIGAACAHFLMQSGWRVTLLDRQKFGAQCSGGNCGFVCPSHVLPLAAPGQIQATMKWMLKKNSPFFIKPRLSLTFMKWLFQFARKCNRRDMLQSAVGIQALLNSSRGLYDQLVRTDGIECEWKTQGLLFVFQSHAGMDHYAETNHLLSEQFAMPAKRFDGPALNELEPALKPGLGGGWLYETDAHLRPDRLMASWRTLLEKQGAQVLEDCTVHGFTETERGRATGVQTSRGPIAADAVVVATGAMTPFLNEHLGCRIPIQPGKGYSITMPRPARCPTIPMIFEEHRVAVTPMATGYRIGSMMEFVGYDETIKPRRLEWLRTAAAHYLYEPTAEPEVNHWFGWRPMTTDSRPIIDRSPRFRNVLIAAGHNMLGLSMAPGTGKLIAELLNDQPTHIPVTPYRVDRF